MLCGPRHRLSVSRPVQVWGKELTTVGCSSPACRVGDRSSWTDLSLPPSALNFWRRGLKKPPPPADPTPVLIGAGLGLIFLSLSEAPPPLLCLPVMGESMALEVGEMGSGPAVATASNRAAMTGYEIMSPVTCWTEPDRELLCGVGRGKDVEVGEGAESSSEGEESELCGSGGRAGRFGGVENAVPRLLAGRSARSTRRGQRAPCVCASLLGGVTQRLERGDSPSPAAPRSSIGSATPPNPRPACVGSASGALMPPTVDGSQRDGDKETTRSLVTSRPFCLA